MISAIIVAYNEEECIEQIIDELQNQDYENFEIILADGGSSDNTLSIASKKNIIINKCRKGRARQMNDASKVAKGDIFFFVHADMKLQPNTLNTIQKAVSNGIDGGGFSNKFDEHNDKIKQIGSILNFRLFDKREQSDKGIFYGDNGIFVKKEVFEKLNGFKEIPIMEDYEFSLRMHKISTVKKIYDPMIVVSSRRHIKAGFWKTRIQWILIRVLYRLKIPPSFLKYLYPEVK